MGVSNALIMQELKAAAESVIPAQVYYSLPQTLGPRVNLPSHTSSV